MKTAVMQTPEEKKTKEVSMANSKKLNKHSQTQPIKEANAPSMMRKEKSD